MCLYSLIQLRSRTGLFLFSPDLDHAFTAHCVVYVYVQYASILV